MVFLIGVMMIRKNEGDDGDTIGDIGDDNCDDAVDGIGVGDGYGDGYVDGYVDGYGDGYGDDDSEATIVMVVGEMTAVVELEQQFEATVARLWTETKSQI